jgi:hypothetical protein
MLGEQHWLLLDATEQTRAIYREIRRLDLEETMTRRALVRAEANADEADPSCLPPNLGDEPTTVTPRCSAFIKTRAGHRCGWHPVITFEGQLYCGFHNPQRRMGRSRMPQAVNANSRFLAESAVSLSRTGTATL